MAMGADHMEEDPMGAGGMVDLLVGVRFLAVFLEG